MHELDEEILTLINQSFHRKFSFVATPEKAWHPMTDVFESGNELVVKMELAGISSSDVQVLLEGNRLVVQGVRKDEHQDEKRSYHRMEVHHGPFRRVILLPLPVNAETIKADYRNGFLEVRLPLAERATSESMVINIE
jgi:HSP20 family protein